MKRATKRDRGLSTDLELPLTGDRLTVAGLFAGIGGLERGLHMAGHRTEMFCEIDEAACRVLRHHYPSTSLERDVRDLRSLPKVDLVAGGFPCQDLSQAGRTAGIQGANSGLVSEVFRLLRSSKPRWLLLENVPFMLSLDQGRAMHYLTESLEGMGFRWAYRVVDSRAFGLPQRRQRVLLLASRKEDPRNVLLAAEKGEPPAREATGVPCGFYWTEGLKGLGWAVDAIPTLKGGSTLGIPSPPAIWLPDGNIVTPHIRDAERLQGFPEDWTAPAVEDLKRKNNPRWKLVGNAVSVPVAEWVGHCLREPGNYDAREDEPLAKGEKWPRAAWSMGKGVFQARVSEWPVRSPYLGLRRFLRNPPAALSARATEGFLKRARSSSLRFQEGFLDSVEAHLHRMLRDARLSNIETGSAAAGT
ncbi:DNA cytosine methyltransferase [Archangium violaceum]|uniref:DNA cytosine methyltransferase n=1 Tax=Archangium violaceum TaxID=83451 RepID=UPI0009FFFAD5|nr:DNA (cytosine-5-)-methyltransferase [Archangium violaceum]